MTRDEIEEARTFLKTYFPNKSSDRAAFNTICDMAVKSLKQDPSELISSFEAAYEAAKNIARIKDVPATTPVTSTSYKIPGPWAPRPAVDGLLPGSAERIAELMGRINKLLDVTLPRTLADDLHVAVHGLCSAYELEIADLQGDIRRAMANHNADLNEGRGNCIHCGATVVFDKRDLLYNQSPAAKEKTP